VRCFYDADEQIGLSGRHLAEELPAVYGERAGAVVVFIFADYAGVGWTRNRLMIPSCKSAAKPTAVPIVDVVRFSASSPAGMKSV
jgi:hypothetical protein